MKVKFHFSKIEIKVFCLLDFRKVEIFTYLCSTAD